MGLQPRARRDAASFTYCCRLDGILAKMTELKHKQSGTEDASWDKWQGENEMANVVAGRTATPPGLLGYCPSAVRSRGPSSLKGCSSKCASSDGSQDGKIELNPNPNQNPNPNPYPKPYPYHPNPTSVAMGVWALVFVCA